MNTAQFPPARSLAGRIAFVPECRGDPLGAFPLLTKEQRPYNLWLTELILEPVLGRWLAEPASGPVPVAADVDRACDRARRAFREILPTAIGLGDTALLAAMGVTANLERTLALIGELLVDGVGTDASGAAGSGPPFRLSRLWCGLTAYPPGTAYFSGRIHPPAHSSRLDPRRRDPGHLAHALWCPAATIGARCDEAIAVLREGIRRSGLFTPGALRHLRGHSIPARSRGGAPRR